MEEKELRYEIQLDRVQKIALSGIGRALTYVKFAETGDYTLAKINDCRKDGEIFSNDFMPPLDENTFLVKKNDFQAWVFNNTLNEIIESFFIFLEILYFCLEANGTRIRVSSNDILGQIIREWQNEIHDNLRSKNKVQALTDKGVQFSDDEKEVIESFWEIRNLLSHNLGIADKRKKLNIVQGKITLKWYRREIFAKLESGKEIEVTGEPMPEARWIYMRPRRLQTKDIDLNTSLSFSMAEVQQIAWTFWLLVYDISAKFKKIVDGETTPEK